MSTITRLKPDCPPDAHKVMRPPENEVNALLCVRVDPAEIERYGAYDVVEVLALMSDQPNLCCSREIYELLVEAAVPVNQEIARARAANPELTDREFKPARMELHTEDEGCLRYADGAQSAEYKFLDWAGRPENFSEFTTKLGERCLICVDMLSMLILRSISTVYPWDRLLAGDFIRQYLKAAAALTDQDRQLLTDIRYGRHSADIKDEFPAAYAFLRLERKLFLQYPSDD